MKMRIVWLAVQYFGMVFAAGFLLALIRIPFLVPRLGVRMAELIEMPFMLFVITFTSRWLQRRNAELTAAAYLTLGAAALIMMIAAELGVALLSSSGSVSSYLASKDPVSGTAYLLSLLVFGLAPWFWSTERSTSNLKD